MFFLDSSDPKEIRDIFAWGVVSGVTTNPLILAREAGGADLGQRIRDVLAVSTGHVSVELTSETESAMLEEAQVYHGWAPDRICIKVPFSEAGLRVTHGLSRQGVATNVTCLMSFNQAYLAALAGGTYVSIFSGRVRDMGYDVRPVIAQTREQIDREELEARIIIGSVRHFMDVNEALDAGAHIVTVPPPILRKMLHNPKTDETIREFNTAWANRQGRGQ
jgi:transaldolase